MPGGQLRQIEDTVSSNLQVGSQHGCISQLLNPSRPAMYAVQLHVEHKTSTKSASNFQWMISHMKLINNQTLTLTDLTKLKENQTTKH